MYVTSTAVQGACILRRRLMSALEANEGTPEQHEFAARELLQRVRGFDTDESAMYIEYITATG